jgi:hypothetical protein
VKEKSRQKWQKALNEHLEPGERVEAAARGIRAKFWQVALVLGYIPLAVMKRYRAYAITDRNVYVFQASSWSTYKVTKVLEKRPLGQARVEFHGGYLTLDGAHESLVGLFGPGKRLGLAVAEAANRSAASAEATPSGPGITV